MRVIGGTSRGRRLSAAVPKDVRPTTDRVKEAIFDMIFSLGGIEDDKVVDLFCGTGGLGIEALSRGAAQATFVDASHEAIAATEANLKAVGLASVASRVQRNSLPGFRPPEPVQWVFADPPYGFQNFDELLIGFEGATAIIESRDAPVLGAPWSVLKTRRYGTTLVTVAITEPAKGDNQ